MIAVVLLFLDMAINVFILTMLILISFLSSPLLVLSKLIRDGTGLSSQYTYL